MKISYTTSQDKELITKFREMTLKQGRSHNEVIETLIKEWLNSFSVDPNVG